MKDKKDIKKISYKKYLFVKLFFPISIFIFLTIIIISSIYIINENNKLNLFLINQTKLLANLTDNSKLYEVIQLNKIINKNSYIIFRDPIANYEIFYTLPSPISLEDFDNIFIEKSNGCFRFNKYIIFFEESYLSRKCIIIVPKMIYYKTAFITFFYAITIYFIFVTLFYILILKIEKIGVKNLTRQYVFIKYLLEGKYDITGDICEISEIDNIRYGLTNLKNILKERREFYNFLILFQKKLLDLIPVGILIFNERGTFEDANNFGYAQIEREIKKQNIQLQDNNSIFIEKISVNMIISNESLNNINEDRIVELELRPNINFAKKVFGKMISGKIILILVPLNITIEDEKDDKIILLRQTLAFFISDFAHELRSPLNSILGFSQIIKDGIEGDNIDEIKNDGKIINESGQIMMAFIDDIIFLSRLGMKKYDSNKISFSVKLLFSLINYYFKGIYKNKDVSLNIINEVENEEIIADFENIRRLIFIILFYLRSFYPVPVNIEISLQNEENNMKNIKIIYTFLTEDYQKQKISDIFLSISKDIVEQTELKLYDGFIDRKKGYFEIKFSYKK